MRRWACEKNEIRGSKICEIDRMVLENEVTLESPFPNPSEDAHDPMFVTETSPPGSPNTVSSVNIDAHLEPQTSTKVKGKKHKPAIEELLEKDSEKI